MIHCTKAFLENNDLKLLWVVEVKQYSNLQGQVGAIQVSTSFIFLMFNSDFIDRQQAGHNPNPETGLDFHVKTQQ